MLQGRTNNFAHKAIQKLCVGFYYGPNSLAATYPAEFTKTVPEHAVALAMTCVSIFHQSLQLSNTPSQIQNCLEEYEAFGYWRKLDFKGDTYRPVYESMLNLIGEVKDHEYHGRKWDDMRRRWAAEGMWVL